MQPVRTNHIRDAADFTKQFGVSRETADRLTVYATLLAKWQKTINLVAPSTLGDVWHRHFADSAQVVNYISGPGSRVLGESGVLPISPDQAPPLLSPTSAEGATQLAAPTNLHWLDLGSGGGFPGVVAGIMLAGRGGWRLTLIESDQRKCAFLREVVRETGLKALMSVDIVAERIESPANHSKVGTVDVVSARALAALPQLLDWAEPYFGPHTVGVFLKGKDAAAEVAEVGPGWQLELVPSVTDAEARVVVVRRRA